MMKRDDLDTASLLAELLDALGPSAVLAGDAVPERNRNDYSGLPATTPLAVLRPADTAAVSAALRICQAHGVAVVPQGGMTGLCGGSRAGSDEIALSLERLVGIEELDAASATMTVLAGTPLQAVQEAAAAAGFFCPLDLGARGSCSIGGNLATNAGGNRVIRYGMAREMVLGIEAVLPDGTVLTSLNKMIKNNAGFDLKQLFIGSEGVLGVITRVVLKLWPKPASTMVAICAATDFANVLALLQSARQNLGPLLSAFEVMWPQYWDFATGLVRSPFAGDDVPHGAYVLIEALGTDAEQDAPRFEVWLETLLDQGTIPNAVVAQSVADGRAFWAVRDATGELYQHFPQHMAFDVGLPIARMDDYVARCRTQLQETFPGSTTLFYGHIGDGNLHIIVWQPGVDEQPKKQVEQIVYGLVREYGGTVSAEHGIGTLKRQWLGHARSQEQIALMRTLKTALDPRGLLNPGKVF
ncbi:FAD-binding protein [Xylophilus rhododendri]|uniref:FAD-binding protein n=1 Tax=Xylophilus rhododendri TaxID=2697032 RepID=A0A857JCS7_9BURK|nr:FAD-binding oxidoreductase [Xylophilus rhododendri]QHJ00486.1 FAD-binding protein [Xylophilus rhododendri]